MNLYFLVEGKRTERIVYPRWFESLLPGFARIDDPIAATDRNYFLISGEGYPSLLKHLENSFADVNSAGNYDFLVVCLDAEEAAVAGRRQEILDYVAEKKLSMPYGELRIIIQNRTIETWFLGNRRIVAGNSQDHELPAFLQYYDVRNLDPELMGKYQSYPNHASFHESYLKAVFRARGLAYTKRKPGHVCEEPYLRELCERVDREPAQLPTFRLLLEFCAEVVSMSR